MEVPVAVGGVVVAVPGIVVPAGAGAGDVVVVVVVVVVGGGGAAVVVVVVAVAGEAMIDADVGVGAVVVDGGRSALARETFKPALAIELRLDSGLADCFKKATESGGFEIAMGSLLDCIKAAMDEGRR